MRSRRPRPRASQPARRLRTLPLESVLGRRVPVATGPLSRLLGLAYLDRERAGTGLLLPRCSSVHTFGMRFALDLVFLDPDQRPLRVAAGVGPRRLVAVRGASSVLELASELTADGGALPPSGVGASTDISRPQGDPDAAGDR